MSCCSLLLLAALLFVEVTSQFAAGPGRFEIPQTMSVMGTRSDVSNSNANLNIDSSGSLQSSKKTHILDDTSSSGSNSEDGETENSASEMNESDSWSGSSSSSMEYECDCRMVRRVSLMGASDYCLAPKASLSSKCGNIDLAENGACPITGAQPCSMKGHVLANDSICALDEKDETYKCVASKDDLEIQKNGGKKRKKLNRYKDSNSSKSSAISQLQRKRLWLAIVVCVVSGVIVCM
ncbi:uncharacterized protein PHALS_10474 [Plasmopara halstedii]|uniref:RxLR-like protein n=1 Tax=Plasmopara halstedii TaxID=4781 RepID=A0A0P1AID4_PLAHL|nr:uncharacterized protein PHALS_10474 [Plasmopara halstedii]CEG40262.1 hypothetical protein PHALS_10474 [Plasmopara halstedii]|eukprot:XP_024576631.1 hypothetical protein PHALS_10474 [Plasmopara halstedii]